MDLDWPLLRPDSLPALSNRGNCLKELGRRAEAERGTRALALLPSWPAALLADGLQRPAAPATGILCEQAVGTVRGSPFPLALGTAATAQGILKRPALADRALVLDPDRSDALCLKGAALYQSGKVQEAEQVLKRAAGLEPANPSIHTELGRLYCGARRWKEAVVELQAALDAGGAGTTDAKALLEGPLPWTKMRQVYRLLGLVKKWGAERVEAACRKALDAEAVDVNLVGRMLERAREDTDPEIRPESVVVPGRFARDPAEFAATAGEGR